MYRKMRKQITRAAAAALAAVITAGYLPEAMPAFETAAVVFAAESINLETLDKALIINGDNLSSYDNKTFTGTIAPEAMSDFFKLSPSQYTDAVIIIDGVSAKMTIEDLNIEISANESSRRSPIRLRNGASLELTIKGENTLKGSVCGAAINVPEGCTLTVTEVSDGKLTAIGASDAGEGSAAIGASGRLSGLGEYSNSYSKCGTINIKGGTIEAFPGSTHGGGSTSSADTYAAIGTGSLKGETINISGGNITAHCGHGTPGIGGGAAPMEKINITGGNIVAPKNENYKDIVGIGVASYANINGADIGEIRIMGGRVVTDCIGYWDKAEDASGSVYISPFNANVQCEGPIYPAALLDGRSYDYTYYKYNVIIYDKALTYNRTGVSAFVGGVCVSDDLTVSVDKKGIGKVSFGNVYPRHMVAENGGTGVELRVAYDGKTIQKSAYLSLKQNEYDVGMGGYYYALEGTIADAAIKAGDEAASAYIKDEEDILTVIESYESEDEMAKISGYIISAHDFYGASYADKTRDIVITDNNGRSYTRNCYFHNMDNNLNTGIGTVTTGCIYSFGGNIYDNAIHIGTSATVTADATDDENIRYEYSVKNEGTARINGYFVTNDPIENNTAVLTVTDENNNVFTVNLAFVQSGVDGYMYAAEFELNNSRPTSADYISVDKNGVRTACTAETIKYADSSDVWTDGFYLVDKDITLSDRITVNGDVKLILADGKTLNANGGIYVPCAQTISIYGQTEGTGTLNAYTSHNYNAAIGGDQNGDEVGKINIYGGRINAETTGKYGAAIGAAGWRSDSFGKINIYGGEVSAQNTNDSAYGCGIGSGYIKPGEEGSQNGVISIYGGKISAKGYNAMGSHDESSHSNAVLYITSNSMDDEIHFEAKRFPFLCTYIANKDFMLKEDNTVGIEKIVTSYDKYEGEKYRNMTLIRKKAFITSEPTRDTSLFYDGNEHELISGVSGLWGTPVYSLSENGEYSKTIPTAAEAGEYTVYYYIMSNDESDHPSSEKHSAKASIVSLSDNAGTEEDPVIINSAQQWDTLADYYANANNISKDYYGNLGSNIKDKYFKLGNDITVTRPLGTDTLPFDGIFDGDGHTITFNYTTTADYDGLFRAVNQATIKNLHIDGTINTAYKHTGGLIGYVNNFGYRGSYLSQATANTKSSEIRNCLSTITINSSVEGAGYHGGFFGGVNDSYYNEISFYQCHFKGKLLGEATNTCGGFAGETKNYFYRGCVFDPAEITVGEEGSCNFSVGAAEGTYSANRVYANNIYYYIFGTVQGTDPEKEVWYRYAPNDASRKKTVKEICLENVEGYSTDYNVNEIKNNVYGDFYAFGENGKLQLKLFQKTVSFDTDGHGSVDDKKVYKGDTVINIPTLSDEFCEFLGWFTDSAHKQPFDENTVVTDDMTVYAAWYDPYNVKFDANGGTGSMDSINTEWNKEFTLPECGFTAPVGRRFDKWLIDGKSYNAGEKITVSDYTTLKATWVINESDFSKDDENTYTIYTADGWEVFRECLLDNDTYNRFTGKTVKLGADITIKTMAGASNHDLKGTFDGCKHILTLDYTAEDEYAAPFLYTETGCVIKDLYVEGKINTAYKYAAGLIAHQYGSATIENCKVSVIVKSSVDGDGTHSGFVAVCERNSTLNIKGCVFNGKLLTTNGTIKCAGFVGWNGTGTSNVKITDCLYAPDTPDSGEVWVGNECSATFARNGGTFTNCYYTSFMDDSENYAGQGKQAYTVSPDKNVVIDYGDGTEYDVSGITAYATGLGYDEKLYAGEGEKIALNLGYNGPSGAGLIFNGYTADNGTLSDGKLTMPAANVIISADVEGQLLGDVDLNGTVTDADAALVLKYISANKPFFADDEEKNAKAMIAANADGIGGIDMLDVIKILQIAEENKNA